MNPSGSSMASTPSRRSSATTFPDPIGLLPADEPDAGDAGRAVGERGHHREGRRGVRQLAHVDLDAVQQPSAGDRRVACRPFDGGTHLRQHVDEREIALQRALTEAVHRGATPEQSSCRKDVGRGAGVRLDGDVGGAVGLRGDDPGLRVRVLDVDAEARHHGGGHLDVGLRHQGADEAGDEPRAHGRAGEQQPREELAGDVPADRHLSADQGAADDLDGEMTGRADVVDHGAECSHRLHDLRHRSFAHPVRGVDAPMPLPQRRDGQQEPGSGPRLPGVDDRHVTDGLAGRPCDDEAPSSPVGVDLGTEGAEAVDHRLGVVGVEGVGDGAHAVGQRRAHQGPVGDALRAGQRHDDVDGPLHRGDRHRIRQPGHSSGVTDGR